MEENKQLLESGNILYLREHTEQLKIQNQLEKERINWNKLMSISFALLVLFIIVLALWLKFSGIGHNIIYEMSRCG